MSKLVECKSCKHKVDPSAKTCPSCGVGKPGIKGWQGCLGILVFGLVFAGFMSLNDSTKPPLTPAEQRTGLLSKQFSPFNGSHLQLTPLIKASMKNPDSYDHIKTGYVDKGDYLIVETQYRGTNSFGAVVPNVTRAKVAIDGPVIEVLP